MATTLDVGDLRKILQQPQEIPRHRFEVLRAIAALLNEETTAHAGREMVLRALEYREQFSGTSTALDALTRIAGLFPYANADVLDLRDSIAYEFHRPDNMPSEFVFHREQNEVYQRLLLGENVILSAPTSFGKSRIIDAVIATNLHRNVVVVVPTLALIDETRRRLSTFSQHFKIITHLSQSPGERNIFVFTPERAAAYERFPPIDFFAIDEFYKLGAIEEDETRTVALNQAFYKLRKIGKQFYLLGPNIREIPVGLEKAFKCTFYATSFATVVAEQIHVPRKGTETARLIELAQDLHEPTLIFCSSPQKVNMVAHEFLAAQIGAARPDLQPAADWAAANYHPKWIFGRALTQGIGIHHGRLPRSLAQYVVRMFNEERLRFLICTSTLIEGVNTKAKNVVIFDNSIAKRPIDFFTFNNIKGRSGRMFQHFVGRVYIFDDPPNEQLPFVDFPLFTQAPSTPESLLLQLDAPDLTKPSKDRLQRYSDQMLLPLSILRENSPIAPDRQIMLAEALRVQASRVWPRLAWTQFPTYEQLKFVCELIWTHLVDANRKAGVFSGSQLAQKTWQLWQTRSSLKRVLDELRPGKYAAKSPDEAVERVLQFERTWAGFELPRLLMAFSRIQAHVLPLQKLPFGDYTKFAAQVESLFRAPVVAALDEYGVPLQLAERIQAQLRTADDLDTALASLKRLDMTSLRLSSFEHTLLVDAIGAL